MSTERAGTVGAHWETRLRRYEVVVPEDDGSPFGWDDPPTPNRAARRQARTRRTEESMNDKPNELITRIAKAIHRYDYDHDLSRNAIPSVHHRGEAAAVLVAIQDAYVPPPPGSDRDALPDHLLAVIDTAPYLSTGCQVAQALEAAAHRNPELADELQEWARRKHASCRLNNKSTGQLCICAHHPERIAGTTTGPPPDTP